MRAIFEENVCYAIMPLVNGTYPEIREIKIIGPTEKDETPRIRGKKICEAARLPILKQKNAP
jgi:hypothetical protein